MKEYSLMNRAYNYVINYKIQYVIDFILYIIIVFVKLLRRKEGNWVKRFVDMDTDKNLEGSAVLTQLRLGRSRMTP